jgi:hypothetical protein
MKPIANYLDRFWRYSCLTGCLTCLLITVASSAIAEYKKPTQTSAPDSSNTTSAASRGGCVNKDNTQLTAIAPYSHVGQTTSTHPTFAWFIPDGEYFPLEFHLLENTGTSQTKTQAKTIYKQNLASSPGMMHLTLPQNQPGLAVGKKYRWQIVMRCTRYLAVVTTAEMEVTVPTPELQTELSQISGTARRTDFYAKNGFWYDAFEISLKAAEFQRAELQNKLIQDLVLLETNFHDPLSQNQGEKLAQISGIARYSHSK